MTLTIHPLTDPEFDLEELKALFHEYNAFIGIDLGFQNFEAELDALPGKYHPLKSGQLYLARWNGEPAGCAAIYQIQLGTCELKRLYVKPQFQGFRIGKTLLAHTIQDARQLGYRQMVLDSLRRMSSAQGLYQKMGFREIQPYNHNPYPDVYYMALDLDTLATAI